MLFRSRSNEAGKNIKATIQIKDNALIKKVKFIGGKYAAADIKIQDNAHIKKIDTDDDPYSISAIGSNYKKAEITIGGSSDPNKPQQGTVRIDEARNGKPYTVIGSASGGGTVSIKGKVGVVIFAYSFVSLIHTLFTNVAKRNEIAGG